MTVICALALVSTATASATTSYGITWTSPVSVDPGSNGSLSGVGCLPGTTDCVAIDETGHTIASQNGVASAPVAVDGGTALTAIACPSDSTCLAGDGDGNVLTLSPTGAEVSTTVVSGNGFSAISCPAADFCAALDTTGQVFTWDGTGWAEDAKLPISSGGPNALSCASSTFCEAVDTDGDAYAYDGTSWTTQTAIDAAGNGLDGVACPADGYCVAGDLAGDVLTFGAGAWSTPKELHIGAIYGAACNSVDLCQAIADGGPITLNPAPDWSRVSFDDDVTDISCGTETSCEGVDSDGGEITFTASTFTTIVSAVNPANMDPPTISGTAASGATLTADPGDWTSEPTAYAYQWQACPNGGDCADITGATAPTFTIGTISTPTSFRVVVTATNSGGSGIASSRQTPVVSSVVAGVSSPPTGATNQAATAPANTAAITPAANQSAAGSTSSGSSATPAAVENALAPLTAPTGQAARLSAIKRAKAYATVVKTGVTGKLIVAWTVTETVDHRQRTITVAHATQTTKAGTTRVTIKLTAAGVKLLKTRTRVKVSATVSFAYTVNNHARTAVSRRAFTLVR